MPRRIRLLDEGLTGRCDLCDRNGPVLMRYLTKDSGINYEGPWEHPLSPHRLDRKSDLPLAIKGSADQLCYRDWIGLAYRRHDGVSRPAAVVTECHRRAELLGQSEELGLWAFGYAMDNMKPRAWCEGSFPLIPLEYELRETFSSEIERLIDAAVATETALMIALKKLIRKRLKDVRGNLEEPSLEFWQQSERRFRELLSEIHRAVDADADTTGLREDWLRTLSETANRVFDRQTASLDYRAIAPGQLAEAWNGLQRALRGSELRGLLQLPKRRIEREAIAS